jgi:hypothetical protein
MPEMAIWKKSLLLAPAEMSTSWTSSPRFEMLLPTGVNAPGLLRLFVARHAKRTLTPVPSTRRTLAWSYRAARAASRVETNSVTGQNRRVVSVS